MLGFNWINRDDDNEVYRERERQMNCDWINKI